MEKFDVVYPLKDESSWNDFELRFSLRSLEENFSQLGKVWIIGYKPDWIKNISHVSHPDPYKRNKDANLISKIIRICFEDTLTQEFVMFSDDQYLLKKISVDDLKHYYIEDLKFTKNWGSSRWHGRLKNTFQTLNREKKTTYNFEGHIPYLYDKNSFPRIMLNYDFGDLPGFTINSLYLNNLPFYHSKKVEPVQIKEVRAGFFSGNQQQDELEKNLAQKTFLCHNDSGLSQKLKDFLHQRFPNKSRFEN